MGTVLARPRAARRRETAIYTLDCPTCGKPLLQTDDLGYALDERDHHGLSTLHDVSVWVRVAGRSFQLVALRDILGRELSLK